MLIPIFWKKVRGRWRIVEHQIPSIKMLLKTNTKSHKQPSIRLFIREQDTIGKPKKTKSSIESRIRALPRNTVLLNVMGRNFASTEWHTCCMYIYTSYNSTHIKNAYIYIYIYMYVLTQSFWTGTKVIWRKLIIQPTGFGACSSICCQWDVPAPWGRSNSHPPVRVQNSYVNQFILYNICNREVFAINNSKLRNCVIVAIECFLQQLIVVV